MVWRRRVQIINEMAVQTAMLNQDRCTKNYYVMQDPTTSLCDAARAPQGST